MYTQEEEDVHIVQLSILWAVNKYAKLSVGQLQHSLLDLSILTHPDKSGHVAK